MLLIEGLINGIPKFNPLKIKIQPNKMAKTGIIKLILCLNLILIICPKMEIANITGKVPKPKAAIKIAPEIGDCVVNEAIKAT